MAADYSDYRAPEFQTRTPRGRAARDIYPHNAAGTPEAGHSPILARGQRLMTLAGAAGSVALVASLAWWGWDLAMRDLRGVPVVRAMEGPMRTAPENPEGVVVDHQGLAVNDVAARDGAAPSDRVVLAPAPVELTLEDVAGLSTDQPVAPEAVAAGPAALAPLEAAPAPLSQEDAVAAALAEALGEPVFTAAVQDQANLPPGAMAASLRPRLRPDAASGAAATTGAAAVAPAAEIDAATLEAGTRLVQFGAYDSAADARAQWDKLSGRLGPLMAGKARVIEAAESGGQTFWRLRGHGFENDDDARRFCTAALAEGVNCIPVTQR